jgi:hypothetical protein
MLEELQTLWRALADPEYLQLLVEPLALHGLVASSVLLAAAVFSRESKAIAAALLLSGGCAASVWPAANLRAQAEPRVIATRDVALAPLIKEQTARRAQFSWAFKGFAILAAAAFLAHLTGKGRPLLLLTLAASLPLIVLALWLHKKESEIHHRNILKPAPIHSL